MRSPAAAPYSLAVALVLLVVTACGLRQDYVLVNRSQRTVAIAPGIILPGCSSVPYSYADLQTAGAALIERHMNDDTSWIPAGATVVEIVPPPPTENQRSVTVIISGSAAPRVVMGDVSESDLPACIGAPMLSSSIAQ